MKHFESKEQEAAGLCPWRNKSADTKRYFPGADRVVETNLIVSSQRMAVTKRLGRTPTGDENALRTYKIMRGNMCCGIVIARRVRGEYGLIELVLIVDGSGQKIKAAYIQRLREPEPAASALQSSAWLSLFNGMDGDSDWGPVSRSAILPPAAYTSAAAVTSAARTAMILLSTAQSIHVAAPLP